MAHELPVDDGTLSLYSDPGAHRSMNRHHVGVRPLIRERLRWADYELKDGTHFLEGRFDPRVERIRQDLLT